MSWYRLSKHDPALRSPAGAYQVRTWTACTDIGQALDGQILTPQAYLAVEDAYAAAVLELAKRGQVTEVQLVDLEGPHTSSAALAERLGLPDVAVGVLTEGMRLPVEGLADVTRLLLREVLWLRALAPGFELRAGYDYHLHLRSPMSEREVRGIAQDHRLFIEPWTEPTT